MTTRLRSAKPVEKTAGERPRLPAELSQLNLNAAGIDVGATSHFVAVPQDRVEQPVREFEAFTADLYRLADWLAQCGVETVVMESTGVYWIPRFGVLEERGFQVMLVDPQAHQERVRSEDRRAGLPVAAAVAHLRTAVGSVPSRRGHPTPAQLPAPAGHAGGVRLSSHPAYAEALTQMNVKLQHVISDITGKTGMDIIEAIVDGERDPPKLASARPQDQGRREDHRQVVAGALAGEEHIFELTQALELYRFYHDKIAECDREIEAQLERFEDRSDGEPPSPMVKSPIRGTRRASMSGPTCIR